MINQFSSSRMRAMTGLCAFSLVLVAGACARAPRAVDVQPGARTTLTDANIASIMISADQAEIERGRVAVSTSQNATVRQYAQQMVDDHTRLMQQTETLATERRITPTPGQTTRQIETSTTETIQSLRDREGEDFDRQYIATEISNHQWILDAIDNSLLPGAQDRDLRAALTAKRATVMDHLRRAQEIQARIGRPARR